MNWQSDFVTPHLVQNGQTYIQQHPVASKQSASMVNSSSTTYGSSYNQNARFNPNAAASGTITSQYAPIQSQQHQYTQMSSNGHSHQFIPASVPHFNGHSSQLKNQQSSSPVSDRTNGITSTNPSNLYQIPVAHVSTASSASSNTPPYIAGNPIHTLTHQPKIVHHAPSPGNTPQYTSPVSAANSLNMAQQYTNQFNQQHQPQQQQSASNKSNGNLTAKIIESLRRNNVKIIAFDFDCTIVNIHTGGQWCDSAEKLSEFVRPCFKELIPALLKCPDFFVCVATYSPQEDLIREVLKITMKDEYAVNDLINKVIIKGNTREFVEEHGIENCYSNGKQLHLAFCRDFFESLIRKFNKENSHNPSSHFKINNDNIILIDDDIHNLKTAYENGHLAFQVNNSVQLVDFYNFLEEI